MSEPLLAAKALFTSVAAQISSKLVEWHKRAASAREAMRGGNLARQTSLEYLVEQELKKLAARSDLPDGLGSEESLTWLLSAPTLQPLIAVLVQETGGTPGVADADRQFLAQYYEEVTGETQKLAPGRIKFVVDYVVGQLRSASALSAALQSRMAAQIDVLSRAVEERFPSEDDMARLRAVSEKLLLVGKERWKMPVFLAPLTLELRQVGEDERPQTVTGEQIVAAIEAGEDIALYGEGGIGKTTFMLELASMCTGNAVPLYVDASVWSESGLSMLDYLERSAPGSSLGVSANELAKHTKASRLILMINGWNEIAAASKARCEDEMLSLTTTLDTLRLVVVSRSAQDMPRLRSPRRIHVRGLSWRGQTDVIRSELNEERARGLVERLGKNARLREAAKSPLILRGLIAQAQADGGTDSSEFDILGQVVVSAESAGSRGRELHAAPIYSMQAEYLEAIACAFNERASIQLKWVDVLAVVGSAARAMESKGILGSIPQPSDVLNVLVGIHVLYTQDDLVRFAHQRLQEYFSAARLLRSFEQEGAVGNALALAINEPFWDDALKLVCGKLEVSGVAAFRASLVRTAASVDLCYACELAGRCGFRREDDPMLHDLLVKQVEGIGQSTLEEVRDYATLCCVSSRLPFFADAIWRLLENNDVNDRRRFVYEAGRSLVVSQLGPDVESRLGAWTSSQRADFYAAVFDNVDNYSFVVFVASKEEGEQERASAISSLIWNYPGSDDGIECWLEASLEVQLLVVASGQFRLASVQSAHMQRVEDRLLEISAMELEKKQRRSLVLAFPELLGASNVAYALEELEAQDWGSKPDYLLKILRKHAPDRLLELALQQLLKNHSPAQWVEEELAKAPPGVRAAAFERVWKALTSRDLLHMSAEMVGPLANLEQTMQAVRDWLRLTDPEYGKYSEEEYKLVRQMESILRCTPEDHFLRAVVEIGAAATYGESVRLIRQLHIRLSRHDRDDGADVGLSKPPPAQIAKVVAVFRDRALASEDDQVELLTYLSSLVSMVDPESYRHLILKALEKNLDAWALFKRNIEKWSKSPGSVRPTNPMLGDLVNRAMTNWGMSALPFVLQYMNHPAAMELVPQLAMRILVQENRVEEEKGIGSINSDVKSGLRRRQENCVLKMRDFAHQRLADQAADALAHILAVEFERQEQLKLDDPKWNAELTAYALGRKANLLARIPSPNVDAPISKVLASGLLSDRDFIEVVRGLVRQGWSLSRPEVVRELEATVNSMTAPGRFHHSEVGKLSDAMQLLLLVEPPEQLDTPLKLYMSRWKAFEFPNEIYRRLSHLRVASAWSTLVDSARDASSGKGNTEEIVYSLKSSLSADSFSEFTELVADGSMASWCKSPWTMKRMAKNVGPIVMGHPERVKALVDACTKAASADADALALEVLEQLDGHDEVRLEYLVSALDQGRATRSGDPAFDALNAMFSVSMSIGANTYEVRPGSSNRLRAELYKRAKSQAASSASCRRLLAAVENDRRLSGRPTDEPRRPVSGENFPWTNVLAEA